MMKNELLENLQNIDQNKSKGFLEGFLQFYLQNGFQSLSKKDIDLLLFYLMEEYNIFNGKDNYQKAKQLKITPTKLKSLQLESYMRWGKQTQREILLKLFARIFSKENIDSILKEQKSKLDQGYIPLMIENPVEKLELERILKDNNSIVEYNLNKEVIDVKLQTLILISYLTNDNKKNLLNKLNKFSQKYSLKELVTKKDIKELTINDFRQIINEVGYESISHIGKEVLSSLMKIIGTI
jgi:hypothetical protein